MANIVSSITVTASIIVLCYTVSVTCSCPTIITRSQWNARRSLTNTHLPQNPPPFVMIHHSDGATCTSVAACKTRVLNIQNTHMNQKNYKDIGYNFLIGGDGSIYEGRGWGKQGSHCPKYNAKSIGICLIGNFEQQVPPAAQLAALRELISCGVSLGNIKSDYDLIGHRQGRATACPGDALFNEIQTWPHFNANIRNN